MRAWVLNNPGRIEDNPVRVAELAVPEPMAGELRVKVSACGVCHTDLHEIEGEMKLPKLPLTPGHQVVGTVDKVGAGVAGFKTGERVGLTWLFSACGKCDFCRTGRENLCAEARFTGFHHDGGYAEYMVARAEFTFHLPENCDDLEVAPLLCAGIIGWRSFKLSEAKKGETLGLFGFGASAHLVCQVARYLGVEVFAFSRGQDHQDLARKLGAAWAGAISETPPRAVDRGIVFAPSGKVVLDALRHLRRGGTLALNAVYMDNIPEMDYNRLLFGEKKLCSVSNLTRQDAKELLELAPKIPLKTEVEVFPFHALPKALLLLKQGKINGAAVLKVSA